MKDTRDYINEIKESMRYDVSIEFENDLDEIETISTKEIDLTLEAHNLRDKMTQFLYDDLFTYIDNYCIYYHQCFEIVNDLRTFTDFSDCDLGLEITNIEQLAFSMLHAELMNDGTIYYVIDEILEEAKQKREGAMSC